jgi:hypothetical protein
MCILCFHACAGNLQHYKTLFKELNVHPASPFPRSRMPASIEKSLKLVVCLHPASDPVPPDQYEVECASLSDCNLNVSCKSGICYLSKSMLVMLHH